MKSAAAHGACIDHEVFDPKGGGFRLEQSRIVRDIARIRLRIEPTSKCWSCPKQASTVWKPAARQKRKPLDFVLSNFRWKEI